MTLHYQRFKLLPLNFLDNLVHPHVLRGIRAHTNSFIPYKKNKLALACAKDLVYMHSNLRLLLRCNEEYVNVATKKWDIVGDSWSESDIHGGVGIIENATLTLDELELEAMVIGNASTSVTTRKSEFQSETIDLDNEDDSCI